MPNLEPLKPKRCPLCGSTATVYKIGDHGIVKCDAKFSCGLRLETKDGPDLAVTRWNRRDYDEE